MKGRELKGVRLRLGYTQEGMAGYVGIHWNSLARMEREELTITEPIARLVQLIELGAKDKQEGSMKKRKTRVQQFMEKHQISEKAAKAWLSTIGKANSGARWRNRPNS